MKTRTEITFELDRLIVVRRSRKNRVVSVVRATGGDAECGRRSAGRAGQLADDLSVGHHR